MNFTKDPSTHPANGPLSEERLIRVREWLQSSLEYSDGSNRDYMMADAAKAIEELMSLRAAPQLSQPPVLEWTNKQCLEFLSIAFRHAEIKGDLELDDIRLGVKMVNDSRAGAEPVSQPYTLPDRWVAVPVEPTAKMLGSVSGRYMTPIECWHNMIAAAPQQEEE